MESSRKTMTRPDAAAEALAKRWYWLREKDEFPELQRTIEETRRRIKRAFAGRKFRVRYVIRKARKSG